MIVTEDNDTNEITAQGAADADHGFVDPYGKPVQRTRVVTENDPAGGVEGRAASMVADWSKVRLGVEVSADQWDPSRCRAGDAVDVYDPDAGLVDPDHPSQWRGRPIWPVQLRARAVTWPVTDAMTVVARVWNGTAFELLDITEWVDVGTGPAQLEVGADQRTLASAINQEAA